MNIGCYLTGPFGQSQELYAVRNEAKRKRGSEEAVQEQIGKDTKRVIALQEDAGFDYIIDPQFSTYYLFQPLNEHVEGIRAGPQENYFNNNVFYWRPVITGPIRAQHGFTEKHLAKGLPDQKPAMAILPSPYTILALSVISGYQDKQEAVENIAELLKEEAEHLARKGFLRIQYDEPAIVHKQSLGSLTKEDMELLNRGMRICGTIAGATTALHTYFGDAGPIIKELVNLPVDAIGIDCTETSLDALLQHQFHEKELVLGLLDARNTYIDSSKVLADIARDVWKKTRPKHLWITPNTATEYRGFSHGIHIINTLGEIRRHIHVSDL